MGFFSEIIGATVKTVLTPVAIIKDVAEVATGGEANNTKDLIESVKNDLTQAAGDLSDGEM